MNRAFDWKTEGRRFECQRSHIFSFQKFIIFIVDKYNKSCKSEDYDFHQIAISNDQNVYIHAYVIDNISISVMTPFAKCISRSNSSLTST